MPVPVAQGRFSPRPRARRAARRFSLAASVLSPGEAVAVFLPAASATSPARRPRRFRPRFVRFIAERAAAARLFPLYLSYLLGKRPY